MTMLGFGLGLVGMEWRKENFGMTSLTGGGGVQERRRAPCTVKGVGVTNFGPKGVSYSFLFLFYRHRRLPERNHKVSRPLDPPERECVIGRSGVVRSEATNGRLLVIVVGDMLLSLSSSPPPSLLSFSPHPISPIPQILPLPLPLIPPPALLSAAITACDKHDAPGLQHPIHTVVVHTRRVGRKEEERVHCALR